MLKRLLVSVAIVVMHGAAAALADDVADCWSSDFEVRIAACTRIIESGGGGVSDYIPLNLADGDRGFHIEALQSLLANQGYDPGEIDGVYGPSTYRALRAFQARQGGPVSVPEIFARSVRQFLLKNAYLNRGVAYDARPSLSAECESWGLDLEPDHLGFEWFDPACFNDKNGDFELAITDYDRAIQVDPNFGLAYFNRGLAHEHINDLPHALADYREAARLLPKNHLTKLAVAGIAGIEEKLSEPRQPTVLVGPAPSEQPALAAPSAPETSSRHIFSVGGGAVVTASIREFDDVKVNFITVEGEFKPGDEKSFKQAVLTVDGPALVSFRSPGGDLQAGMEIGRTIWTNQFMTIVEEDICAWACALAWLGGRPRFATTHCPIGLPAPTLVEDPDRKADSVGSAFVGGYLTELGFTSAAIAYMTEAGPDEMNWLTSDEARSLGIYVEDIDAAESTEPTLSKAPSVVAPPEPPGSQCEDGILASVGDAGVADAAKRCLKPGDVFRDLPDGPEMVVVPAGRFMMGSPVTEEGRDDDEGPQHEVTIAQPFAVGKFEVTFDEWDACVADGDCSGYRPDDRGWGRDRRPVISVNWDDAKSYVEWLSKKTGRDYRLLSEAEWEYAARAGTTTPFSTGGTITTDQANFALHRERTVPVGTFAANAFGLHDMHGNVWEWVEDCWNDSYASAPTDGAARLSGECIVRVLRGGSRLDRPRRLRSASRIKDFAEFGDYSHGFRIARTLNSGSKSTSRESEETIVQGWLIQLAAVTSEEAALQILNDARTMAPEVLTEVSPYADAVVKGGITLYRARFAGFPSLEEARMACALLTKKNFACLAVRAGRARGPAARTSAHQ